MTEPARPRKQRTPLAAIQRALGLLTRREHSRKELSRKLVARGLDANEVEATVQKLAGEGWQSDGRFAEALVRSRAGAGYGPMHIRAELGTHGLDRDAVLTAMDAFEGDWARNARDLVIRRYGTEVARDRALQRKAADLLMRRGFASEHVRAATRFDAED